MNIADSAEESTSSYDPEAAIPSPDSMIAIALASLGALPLHALRHPVNGDQCGWYIWGGELSDSDDFFSPLHVSHTKDYAPDLVPYLGLGPGWRVLLAPGQVDVWYDASLLAV